VFCGQDRKSEGSFALMKYRLVTPKNIVPIAIAEVSSSFASLLDRVRVEKTEFVIEENGQPVAVSLDQG
jgi:hypothetical protein